eukprot:scaffold5412_cov129-Isochrysis_galbana.AAC.1
MREGQDWRRGGRASTASHALRGDGVCECSPWPVQAAHAHAGARQVWRPCPAATVPGKRWATPRDTPRYARCASCMRCSGCRRTSVLTINQLRQQWQWIDNNMSYLDGRALAVLQSGDSTFRRDS